MEVSSENNIETSENNIVSTETPSQTNEIEQIEAVSILEKKPKKKYKPYSEEVLTKKREQLAVARAMRKEKYSEQAKEREELKTKVQQIKDLDIIIESKIKEKIVTTEPKPQKDKTAKQEAKKKMIESLIEEKLKNYKPKKQLTDFQLIQRFF